MSQNATVRSPSVLRQSFRFLDSWISSSRASFWLLMRPMLFSGSEDMEFWRWRHPFLFQSDISRSPAHHPFIFRRWTLLDRTFPTCPRSSRSDHSLSRTSFSITLLLIPLCTRKTITYLSYFTITSHRFRHVLNPFFELFLVVVSVFDRNVVFPVSANYDQSLILPVSFGHFSLKILLFFFIVLGHFSLVYHPVIMFWPFSVCFTCYPHIFGITIHRLAVLSFLPPPPPTPFTSTHWESGGWSRFIRHFLLPSFEGSPSSVTLSAELSEMFGTFGMVR